MSPYAKKMGGPDAAAHISLAKSTLAKFRCRGEPPFSKAGFAWGCTTSRISMPGLPAASTFAPPSNASETDRL
jgi:hypothetical protein